MRDEPAHGREGSRPISWVKAAHKDFSAFPDEVQVQTLTALEIAASGETADIAKPLKGLGPGVYEIAVRYRTDAYRTVYAVKLDDQVWVIHAFQKKSKQGIATPQTELDTAKNRIKALKEMLAHD